MFAVKNALFNDLSICDGVYLTWSHFDIIGGVIRTSKYNLLLKYMRCILCLLSINENNKRHFNKVYYVKCFQSDSIGKM